ncbi:lytic polysaccharide monooxygenase [Pseudomonas maumuensis]|uniref:Lytic polysaccharide monooxygenase n=1 Tax=Pseudomonas maumuensis TaxID=2842354 RepID=A0ABX8NMW3_9PSED|nr:lytic polysaccharide monooxygenase [Pseudomonas maumuensis]QXH57378.1 lytic polysaccharide monooxygenase [Pseudomonas maumuensis]
MKPKYLLHTTFIGLLATAAVPAHAAPIEPMHGAMEVPVARQLACHNAQDYYWPEDGTGIKSPGCKAAYQHVYRKFGNDALQAAYQFNQWHEVSKNVKDFNNIEAVKKAIPDGQLCSAGNVVAADSLSQVKNALDKIVRTLGLDWNGLHLVANDKSGLDQPAAWATQELRKGTDDKVRMRYKIQAVHNPSFWEIYVSKPDYDPAQRALNWDDLELVQKIGNVAPVNGYYELDVDLKKHTGKRVIYSRWQRDDSAGEGFYNCSDVNIVSAK